MGSDGLFEFLSNEEVYFAILLNLKIMDITIPFFYKNNTEGAV